MLRRSSLLNLAQGCKVEQRRTSAPRRPFLELQSCGRRGQAPTVLPFRTLASLRDQTQWSLFLHGLATKSRGYLPKLNPLEPVRARAALDAAEDAFARAELTADLW
jgi:hypothetical protein